jgi:hypothetical protein
VKRAALLCASGTGIANEPNRRLFGGFLSANLG